MNFLRRFAKPETPKKDATRSIRLPSELAQEFDEHCQKWGLNFNEGIQYLIMLELGKIKMDNAAPEVSVTKESRPQHTIDSSKLESAFPSLKNATPKEYNVTPKTYNVTQRKHNVVHRRQSGKYTVKPYEIDGSVPCPICGNWQSYKNYARHCRDIHGMTPQEIIEGNLETVKAMVERRRGGHG